MVLLKLLLFTLKFLINTFKIINLCFFPQPKFDGPKFAIVLKIDKLSSNEPTSVVISSPLKVCSGHVIGTLVVLCFARPK